MFTFIKRPLYYLSNKLLKNNLSEKSVSEKRIAEFTNSDNPPFDIKSENSYNAYLEVPEQQEQAAEKFSLFGFMQQKTVSSTGALILELKKANCIAWVEAPDFQYQDQVIEAKFSLNSMDSYAAAGLMFRMVDNGTYYLALISSKGYFRLDAVRNNEPLPLIGWVEIPGLNLQEFKSGESILLTIIAYGNQLIFTVDGHWVAETEDSSISGGHLALALASYEAAALSKDSSYVNTEAACTCSVKLEYLAVDYELAAVEEQFDKWNNSPEIRAESRLLLAETFAAMNKAQQALSQIQKSWERREDTAKSITATYTDLRAKRELLLAMRMARLLGAYSKAEEYINACLEHKLNENEENEITINKAYILYDTGEYEKLKKYIPENIKNFENPVLYSLLGHALWNLKEYLSAANAFSKAYSLEKENGIYAVNAADCFELAGKKQTAFKLFLEAGKIFLAQENYKELGEIIPRLPAGGARNWEAHALAGKWAFGTEDFNRAEEELILAEKIRLRMKQTPPPDPAVFYLRALLLIRKGQRRIALNFLEEAVRYAPSYGLFHFRLAENLFLQHGNAGDPRVKKELKAALSLMPEDGWVNNFAAQIDLANNDFENAQKHLQTAINALGEIPVIKVNRSELYYLQGSKENALAILESDAYNDPEGIMANYAANLCIRSGDLEKADSWYRKALSAAPDNAEFIRNRASCLIELGYYGQAEDLLAKAEQIPEILNLLSHIAVKRGDYKQAEEASLAALEKDKCFLPSLFSLGWIYCNTNRFAEMQKIISKLNKMQLDKNDTVKRDELNKRYQENIYRIINCASCSSKWKIRRDCKAVQPIRLHAMPPDDFPAGSCSVCGNTYCIGCAKKRIDANGRFICKKCKTNLKLSEEGLKKIIFDWAVKTISDNSLSAVSNLPADGSSPANG